MEIIADVLRRACVVLLVARVFVLVVVGELVPMGTNARHTHQLRPKGAEWRTVRRVGLRIIALRLQVILA